MVFGEGGGCPFTVWPATTEYGAGVAGYSDFEEFGTAFVECEEAAGTGEGWGEGFGCDKLGGVFEDFVDGFVDDFVVEAEETVFDGGVDRVGGGEGKGWV